MANKKYIQTPRGYLSQSQVSLWQRNPEQYKALYFDDRKELRHSSPAMDYGKVIADALEKGVQTDDLLSDAATLLLPKYDIADVEFRAEFKTDDGWVVVLAKPDSMDSVTKDFLEYKTGKTVWTQTKAQALLQMHWYAASIYIQHEVIPKAKLVWIETEITADGIKPTGRIESFDVTFTMTEILRTMSLMGKVAKEIAIAWASHVTDERIAKY